MPTKLHSRPLQPHTINSFSNVRSLALLFRQRMSFPFVCGFVYWRGSCPFTIDPLMANRISAGLIVITVNTCGLIFSGSCEGVKTISYAIASALSSVLILIATS